LTGEGKVDFNRTLINQFTNLSVFIPVNFIQIFFTGLFPSRMIGQFIQFVHKQDFIVVEIKKNSQVQVEILLGFDLMRHDLMGVP
jgi:hypothetical protein